MKNIQKDFKEKRISKPRINCFKKEMPKDEK